MKNIDKTNPQSFSPLTDPNEYSAFLRSILQSPMNINIWAVDRDICYTFFNASHKKGMKKFWGADIEVGKPLLSFLTNPSYIDAAKQYYSRIFQGEQIALVDELYDLEGDLHFFENHGSPVFDESGRILGATIFTLEITERIINERKIKKALEEKQFLLREIHHRIKNNLQIISSLMEIQGSNVRDNEIRSIFINSQNRIQTIAAIHDLLHQSEDLSCVEMESYIKSLIYNLSDFYSEDRIDFAVKITPVKFSLDTAIPLGLMINELVTNSKKYAFPGKRKGRITVTLEPAEDPFYRCTVEDNGLGIMEKDSEETKQGLGLQIVEAMVNQLAGSYTLESGKGTKCIIRFKAGLCKNPD